MPLDFSVRGRDAIRFFCTGSAMSFLYGVGDAIRFFCTGSAMSFLYGVGDAFRFFCTDRGCL